MIKVKIILLFIFYGNIAFSYPTDDNQQTADSLEKYAKAVIFKIPKEAEKAGLELIQIAKKINSNKSLMNGYNIVGLSLYYTQNYEIGIPYFDTLIKIAKQNNDTVFLGKAFTNAGLLHEKLGDYESAYRFGIEGLKIAEITGNQASIANSLGNLANISIQLKNHRDAIAYLEKAIPLLQKLNNKKTLANLHNSLGSAYTNIDSKKSLQNYFMSKKIYEEIGDPQLTTILINIAIYHSNNQNKSKAIELFLDAKKHAEKYNQEEQLGIIFLNLSTCYSSIKDHKNANQSINEAEKIFKKIGFLIGLANVKKKRAIISQNEGNYEKAINELEEFKQLSDSVIGLEKQKTYIEAQEKYNSEKKDLQLKLQQSEIKEQQEKTYYTRLIFFVVLAFILLTGFFLFLYIKHRQKIKTELEIIKTKETERNQLAAELHDNIGSSISFMSLKIDQLLNQENLNNNDKPEITRLKETAQDIIGSLRETLWTLNTKSISNIDLCDKLKIYIKKHSLCQIKFNDQLHQEFIIPNEKVLMLYRCAQEIINNINKHSKATLMEVQFISETANTLILIFTDNGIGFEAVEKDESYGLRNLKTRIEKINGTLLVKSTKGKGTTITINYEISA